MPKKSHGRTPKAKARSNHTAPRATAPRPPDTTTGVITAGATTTSVATAPPVQRQAPAPPAARRSSTSARMPVTVVNYAYLRHDLRLLSLLAPAMVIILVLAFIFLH